MNISYDLKSENLILKRLIKDSYILINYDSTDCDGCSTSKVLKFESLEQIYESMNACSESHRKATSPKPGEFNIYWSGEGSPFERNGR